MIALGLILAYGIPAVIGTVLLTALQRGKTLFSGGEKIALGVVLGIGLVGFYLFYLGIAGVPYGFWSASAIVWPFIIWGIVLVKQGGWKRLIGFARPALSWGRGAGEKILVSLVTGLLAWKCGFAFFVIFSSPTYFDDSVSVWNYKAKVYYSDRRIIWDRPRAHFLGGSSPHYPNGVPLGKCWLALCANEFHEGAVNSTTGCVYLCLGWLFYLNLRRFWSRLLSFLFTYLLLSVPLITVHAGFAYFDLTVGFYFLLAFIYLHRWMETRSVGYLIVSALACAVGISVKDEMNGLVAAGMIPAVVLYQLRERTGARAAAKNTLLYLAVILGLNAPWFVVKLVYGLQWGLYPGARKLEFHLDAFSYLYFYFFNTGNYNILWLTLIAVIAVSWPVAVRSSLRYLMLSLALATALVLGLFIFTPFFQWLKVGTTINRSMLTLIPAFMYYAAVSGRMWFETIAPTRAPGAHESRRSHPRV